MSDARRAADVPPNEMIGSSVQRREDPRLITGDAEYTDDIQHHRDYHLAIHRSQYGHATIEAVDTADAEAMDGVVKVYTGADFEDSGLGGRLPADDPENGAPVGQPVLAFDRVHYQGQPIAAVLAEDRYTAVEAAGAVDVEYDRRDAVIDPMEALEGDGPTLHEEAPDNVAFDWDTGDPENAADAVEQADHTVDIELEI
ncbi:MAG: xanthine dehydrogenase family protein molybdopterin-binding subunit, partial [Salinirussus sp.]